MMSLLSLGDSYTIGEGVPLYESFPYQTVQLLRKAGRSFYAPEIIARTGWTTDELALRMTQTRCLPVYDVVSLLIGVNNQYRGRDCEEYGRQFEGLVRQAIRLAQPPSASSLVSRVFVLSIPDWSVTPFAQDQTGRDRSAVAREIDAFNTTAETITGRYGIEFINITEHTRLGSAAFAADGLHPAGTEYHYWAERLAERIIAALPAALL